jgi:dual specificity tyrosine-phosphorylation-regulated kinase 2/3/4
MTSLRRKLSLSWKRGGAKNANAGQSNEKAEEQEETKQDSLPPSQGSAATTGPSTSKTSTSNPTLATKPGGTYLESRRRKSSASSLNAIVAQDRTRSDVRGGSDRNAKKDPNLDVVAEGSASTRSTAASHKNLKPKPSSSTIRQLDVWTGDLDKDDLVAEEDMKKLGSRRKETEMAARTLDTLRKRATAKERVSAQDAIRIASLNIYERGEIVDHSDIYFCGTQNAAKVAGNANAEAPNFGYDDERGDYTIVPGDHLAYRYEIVDVLGKGSFGQVVRCIDHKTGGLVALKIIRNKKRFHQQALVEVNILQKLREWVSSHLESNFC